MGSHDVTDEKRADKVLGHEMSHGKIVFINNGIGSPVPDRKTEDPDNYDEEEEHLDFCCLSGCLTMISVAILVFLALPAGILLCTYASSHGDQEVLIVGIVLATSPVISFPLITLILYNRRRIAKLRKRKVSTSSPNNDITKY